MSTLVLGEIFSALSLLLAKLALPGGTAGDGPKDRPRRHFLPAGSSGGWRQATAAFAAGGSIETTGPSRAIDDPPRAGRPKEEPREHRGESVGDTSPGQAGIGIGHEHLRARVFN